MIAVYLVGAGAGAAGLLAFAFLWLLDRRNARHRDWAVDNVWAGIEARRTACTVNATKHRSGR